jgi:hypothetical protein
MVMTTWRFFWRKPAAEDSHVVFTQARARAGALAPQQRDAAYGDWVKLAFQDFRSRGGDPDLEAFRIAVASATASIVDLYDASGSDPERQRQFVERCLGACQALDTGLIWYRGGEATLVCRCVNPVQISLRVRGSPGSRAGATRAGCPRSRAADRGSRAHRASRPFGPRRPSAC